MKMFNLILTFVEAITTGKSRPFAPAFARAGHRRTWSIPIVVFPTFLPNCNIANFIHLPTITLIEQLELLGTLASAAGQEYRFLRHATVGSVFLGTPFRGSPAQRLDQLLLGFHGFMGREVSDTLLKYQDSSTGVLDDLVDQFMGDSHQPDYYLPLHCFYEIRRTDLSKRVLPRDIAKHVSLKKLMVTQDSACLPGRGRTPLDCNHVLMNKFAPNTDNYGKVIQPRTSIHSPVRTNKAFVGRESILQQLIGKIPPGADDDDCQRVATEGLGGAYREIGRQLNVEGIDDEQPDVKLLVKAALEHKSVNKWLLVVDNADDLDLMLGSGESTTTGGSPPLASYLPFSHKASILFTTRNHEVGISMSQYLEFCQSSDRDMVNLLSRDFEDRYRYNEIQNPVATTWLISFRHILAHDPLAADYLRFLCLFAEKDIPKSLLPQVEGKEMEAAEAIGMLKADAFIAERNEQLAGAAGERKEWITKVLQGVHRVFPKPTEYNKARTKRSKRSFSTRWGRVTSSLEQPNGGGAVPASDRRNAGSQRERTPPHALHHGQPRRRDQQAGRHDEVLRTYQHVLDVYRKTLDQDHDDVVKTMNDIGIILEYLDRYDEAKGIFRQVWRILEDKHGETHPRTLDCRDELARSLHEAGKYDAADQLYRQTLALREEVMPGDHPDTLACMRQYTRTLRRLKKYDEVERMCRQVLTSRQRQLKEGEEQPETLVAMGDLARVLAKQGKYEEAEDCTATMNDLGAVLYETSRFEAAEDMFRHLLGWMDGVLPEGNALAVKTRNNLVHVLKAQRKFVEAQEMSRQLPTI
ncbi:hypothetical protein B0H66DRAFT_529625 [Apodospora peruviana]|uniref:Kinesin light chain n=1 Tax=Apodospora peruviana TaxID=516989 RepID=A0AAE0IIH1_9PEZI|nr:hypothetical protein B0H66DRAFT_529625 [Apodospora peruviana]